MTNEEDEKKAHERHNQAHELADQLTNTLITYAKEGNDVEPFTLLFALEIATVAMRSFLAIDMGVPPVELMSMAVMAAACSRKNYTMLQEEGQILRGLSAGAVNMPGGEA